MAFHVYFYNAFSDQYFPSYLRVCGDGLCAPHEAKQAPGPHARGARGGRAPRAAAGSRTAGSRCMRVAGHTAPADVRGFLPSRPPTPCRQAQGETRRIWRLASPVTRAHPAQRCDRIGTDRHAHLRASSGRGAPQWMPQSGAKRLAHGGGGHGVTARGARRDRGRPQTAVCAQVWAGQERSRLTLTPLDQGVTVREVIQSAAPCGAHRAPRGPARWRQLEHAVGPGDEAGAMHAAGRGAPGGWRHAGQQRVRALPRGPATGRHKAIAGRMRWVGACEPAGSGRGEIIQARAGPAVVREQGDGFLPRTAMVVARGGGTPQLRAQPLAPRGNRFPCPRIGHRPPETVDVAQSGSAGLQLMMRGSPGQHGHDRARAQADTAIDPPEQALGKRRRVEGHAPHGTGRIEAHDGASAPPSAARVRPRCLVAAQGPSQQSPNT